MYRLLISQSGHFGVGALKVDLEMFVWFPNLPLSNEEGCNVSMRYFPKVASSVF